MSKIKVDVRLTEDALSEFREIQAHPNASLSRDSLKYLKKLIDLPASHWLEIEQHWTAGVFKATDTIAFDIRGKVEVPSSKANITVFITRFQLKKTAPVIEPELAGCAGRG